MLGDRESVLHGKALSRPAKNARPSRSALGVFVFMLRQTH